MEPNFKTEEMSGYRLDKTYFKAQAFEEADNQKAYWLQKDVDERLKAAWYLISCAYGFSLDDPPRMDKTVFSMRRHPTNEGLKDQDDIEHLR